jgi:hypothetical protein
VIPASWLAHLPLYLWQVALHSSIMGFIFYVWAHRVRLPSGRTKRLLLAILLALPMFTAAIPGRASVEFGERIAWMNSARILAVPLGAGFRVSQLALVVGLVMAVLTIWQELLPSLRPPEASASNVPESLLTLVHSKLGWKRCTVVVSPLTSIMIATSGGFGRARLIVSRGAIESLSDDELESVVAHERAHWQAGRWLLLHALFGVRLLQCYNPVALWVFREYCIEVEIDCDGVAVLKRDPHVLARILLRIYQSTARRDVAARGSLRKRIDVLLGGGPQDAALPPLTIFAASAVMLVVLPWIV